VPFWKFIKNQANETTPESVELRIEGDIIDDGDLWIYEWFGEPATAPNAFKDQLKEFSGQDLTVWIDSYGGSVFAGASIYNALKEHKGKVVVKVDGKAMSAASVIAMAGDEVHMSPVAVIMIHNPLTGAYGDMHDLRKVADILDTVKESIVNAYVNKTGKTSNEISAMMDDETWMSSNVAAKNGFADSVLYTDQPLDVQNMKEFSFNRLSIVNSANHSIKQAIKLFNEQEKPSDEDEIENLHIEIDLI
jgi:ATP-dependent Clp protease protease subunit